jgi:hypothetical protein
VIAAPQQDTTQNIFQFLFFAGILAVVIAALILNARMERKRREELEQLARSLGLDFYPDEDDDFPEQRAHRWFKQGHSRSAKNRIEGMLDVGGQRMNVKLGDFKWVTGAGKHRQVHRHGYLLIIPAWRSLPALEIRPENFFDKVGDALGFDDIDFESAEFSRKFMVKSNDKKFAYAVIHPRMMEFLLAMDGHRIQIDEGECLFLDIGTSPSPDDFRAALGWSERFFGQWPAHLVQELSS